MYYIINQDKQLIATDNDFLSLLQIDSLQALFSKTASGELVFNESGSDTVEISIENRTVSLTQNRYPLATVMGDVILVEVSKASEASTIIEKPDDEISFSSSDEAEDFIKFETEPQPEKEIDLLTDEKSESSFLVDDKEEDFIKLEVAPEVEEDFIKLGVSSEEEPSSTDTINLLPDEEIDFLKPVDENEDDTLATLTENIHIDTDKISKMLGISKEDYSSFLDEFIDKAIEEEEVIKDINSPEHSNAISSLHNLSQMLHISDLSNILEKVENASGEEKLKTIESFYQVLSSLTTLAPETEVATAEPEEASEEISNENQICLLVLDEVKPIHFDFQPRQASEELGLPVDLIEEFVHDFIDQANEEKQTFIDACNTGDIDTIHKTGHKLKGAASNLRIGPLADTLEEIQFCEENARFEPLFKKYWGQFLALEHMMSSISNQPNQPKGEK